MGQVAQSTRCEWPRCSRVAWYRAYAQWTIFDYLGYYVCGKHHKAMLKHLASRIVDGHFPLEVDSVTLPINQDIPLPQER